MYGQNLTQAERDMLFAPSAHLIQFRAFMAEYRRQHPKATPNEAQAAYQREQAKGVK